MHSLASIFVSFIVLFWGCLGWVSHHAYSYTLINSTGTLVWPCVGWVSHHAYSYTLINSTGTLVWPCVGYVAEESHPTFQQTGLSVSLGRILLPSAFCKQLGLCTHYAIATALACVQYMPLSAIHHADGDFGMHVTGTDIVSNYIFLLTTLVWGLLRLPPIIHLLALEMALSSGICVHYQWAASKLHKQHCV